MKVLKQIDFQNQLKELQDVPFNISTSRGYPVLEQTKRNNVRGDLIEGLYHTLSELFASNNVYLTNDGIAIEVENNSVLDWSNEDKKFGPTSSGAITLTIGLKVNNLAYNAYNEALGQEETEEEQF